VSNFVECLRYVEESCGTVMFIIKCFVDSVHDAMFSMDGRVPLAETKLMVRY
jgi:hypothetical protein